MTAPLPDRAHQVPRGTDPAFIDALEQIVRCHAIRLIVPTIDTELSAYAAAVARRGVAEKAAMLVHGAALDRQVLAPERNQPIVGKTVPRTVF